MPTSDITRLLAAKREAAAALAAWHDSKPSPPWTDRQVAEYGWLADEAVRTSAALHAALTDDTIEALVKVAEAARAEHKAWANVVRWLLNSHDPNLEALVTAHDNLGGALATLDAIRPTPDQEGAE